MAEKIKFQNRSYTKINQNLEKISEIYYLQHGWMGQLDILIVQENVLENGNILKHNEIFI